MQSSAIFAPVFAMFGLTFTVWVYMYIRRIRFIRGNDLGPGELTPAAFARLSPPAVANPSDNLENLFEVPVLFYVLALYLHAVEQVDLLHLTAAWTFVVFRVLHSAVHCTVNIVMLRFWLYAISCMAVWVMAARAAWRYLGA